MTSAKSLFDPSRDTVGKIYRDAQINCREDNLVLGDITAELESSLVDDLNDTIKEGTKEFGGKPFFITVYEKKDLQMPKAILRRLYKTRYRPWPEDDTIVFSVTPSSNDVRFCWCLPHRSDMFNILTNAHLYHNDLVMDVRAFDAFDLHRFGFMKDPIGNWIPNPNFIDKVMEKPKRILV